MYGIIFDIQNYAIYDGPGIRTLIFLLGCPLKCKWCQNPESQQLQPQMSYFEEKCVGCCNCAATCPNNALSLINGRIIRNTSLCKTCGACISACPNGVMEKIGENRELDELVEILLMDKPFFDNSGGGITISGGEPTMQINFLFELLKTLKNKGIHTAIETCGYFNENLIDKLVKYVDLFLFDIKLMDSEKHKQFTDVLNEKILTNFSKILYKVGNERIIPRIPLIPGVNTDLITIQQIITFLHGIDYKGIIHLMPYNKLTKTKYEKVGMGDIHKDFGDLTDEDLNKITKLFEQHSYQVIINH
ncbi:MAG: glycyl-radical enzyme activating protein [Candidatus Lokiarchaeota archaeon]|nr:glycyl-radical enzyme activating protein [Candidatus Lokiarchaeota archaeon]